ncbi:chaplin family protein [Actinomadura atramentaria]|uniref:chaplin family protein n=1 Tax=Actinomadura atramentaria TaxID=1990 RepID=UPI0003A4FDD3|nr:chaplin family protein [Actinomadura atramentaria]
MRTWVSGTARATFLTAGFVALGVSVLPTAALADTSGEHGVLSGNQVSAPISAPIEISGNGNAASRGGAIVHNAAPRGGTGHTSGRDGVGSGNQIDAPISAPIDACGNGVALLGRSAAACEGGSTVLNERGGSGGGTTSGKHSVLGGNQVKAPVTAPIDACGNGIAVLGRTAGACEGGSTALNQGERRAASNARAASGPNTTGRDGILSGNQADAPISLPINACGNAVAVLGKSGAGCPGGSIVGNEGGNGGGTTSGEHGVGSGNQIKAPVSAPVDVCGNGIAVLGEAAGACKGGSTVLNEGGHPAAPHKPAKPVKPVKPVQPRKPSKPHKPAKPVQPSKPHGGKHHGGKNHGGKHHGGHNALPPVHKIHKTHKKHGGHCDCGCHAPKTVHTTIVKKHGVTKHKPVVHNHARNENITVVQRRAATERRAGLPSAGLPSTGLPGGTGLTGAGVLGALPTGLPAGNGAVAGQRTAAPAGLPVTGAPGLGGVTGAVTSPVSGTVSGAVRGLPVNKVAGALPAELPTAVPGAERSRTAAPQAVDLPADALKTVSATTPLESGNGASSLWVLAAAAVMGAASATFGIVRRSPRRR